MWIHCVQAGQDNILFPMYQGNHHFPNQSQERSDHDCCGRTSADDMCNEAAAFTNFVNRGGLHVPSEFTMKIVSYVKEHQQHTKSEKAKRKNG